MRFINAESYSYSNLGSTTYGLFDLEFVLLNWYTSLSFFMWKKKVLSNRMLVKYTDINALYL